MVKEGSNVTAHTWNASEGRWDEIGDVVGGSGGSQQASGKQLYQGKVTIHILINVFCDEKLQLSVTIRAKFQVVFVI